MTKEQAEFLKRATEYAGNQEIDVREDYSGRGMYGKTTHGIVIDSWPTLLADVISYIKETALDNSSVPSMEDDEGPSFLNDIPDFNDFRTDNMGRGIIIY